MAIGLGFGDNTTASIITRGLAETARLAMKLDADPLTLMGLAGLGDLVATCSSPLSRNRTFGEKLGQGMSTEEIVASTRQVAEGAKSCAAIYDLADHNGVDAPVAQHVAAVVAGEMSARDMMYAFIARDTKHERDCTTGRTAQRAHVTRRLWSLSARRHAVSSVHDSPRYKRMGGERSAAGDVERPAEVLPEVLDVLDPHREPDQALGDGGGLGLPATTPLQGRLDAAERGGVDPELRSSAGPGRRFRRWAGPSRPCAPKPG